MRILTLSAALLLALPLTACGERLLGWPTGDISPPTVETTAPSAGQTAVPLNTFVLATFNEAMDSATIDTDSFTVLQAGTAVAGRVTFNGLTAVFEPATTLMADTNYVATISADVTDVAGNGLEQAYVWNFTTGLDVDVAAPIVVATTPAFGADDVAFNTVLTATFSEAMDPLSLTDLTFTVNGGGAAVDGDVTYVDNIVTFRPSSDLATLTSYTATIQGTAADLAGNEMGADYVWIFSTGTTADTTVPTVESTDPVADATGVGLDARIRATFSETMDAATITDSTMVVQDDGNEIDGTVSYDGLTVTFAPAGGLMPDATYTATILEAVSDLAGNTLAADVEWSFTTIAAADTEGPEVIATTPELGATDVDPGTQLTAVFSEPMDPLTVSSSTFTVRDGVAAVAGEVTYTGVTATFVSDAEFAPGSVITATIDSAVTDVAGNEMDRAYVWVFTTALAPDVTAPFVVATVPAADAAGVAFNARITATFSEMMDATTLTNASVTVSAGASAVTGSVDSTGLMVTFTPAAELAPSTTYTVVISSLASDLSGNPMVADFGLEFTTGASPDTNRPEVSSTSPVLGATNVAFDTAVTATFTEPMDPVTLTDLTFTVRNGAAPVTGEVVYTGLVARFTPDVDLAPDAVLTTTIDSTVTDLAGNELASDYVWIFSTGPAPDTTAPFVESTVPVLAATDVAFNSRISATFSEPMEPASFDELTFAVSAGATVVPGTVGYTGLVATFDPDSDLLANTTYAVRVSSVVEDLAGNPLTADFVWQFTTGATPDTVRPRVTSTIPADDGTGVALSASIVAAFSETMDALTITADNFTVQQGGASIAGTVTYLNRNAIFNPDAPLLPNTVYAATVTTEVQDLAGNSLLENYVWNFRTGAAPDTTRPTVISTIPADFETGVLLDADVTARFNEAMDPLTLTSATVKVFNGLIPVPGSVTVVGANLSFDPLVNLLPNTEYRATIANAAADLAGNTLLNPYGWTFTTGALIDVIPPTVTLTVPDDLATNVPINASVNATFSESMRPLSVTTVSFILTRPDTTAVAGTVSYDLLTRIATFSPADDLQPNTTYTATITTGVADLSGLHMESDDIWTFTTGADPNPGLQPVDLGSLSTFVAVSGAGLTNSNSSGITILNGDVGLSPTATCTGDGSPCSITNPVINGTLYANDPEGVAAQTKTDLVAAYIDAASRPVGTTVNDISGMVLVPGVYTSGSTMSVAVNGTVTLDGQGDANAVFIFQVGSSLTINNGASVVLVNGASAKNVFWAVFASSTLGSNVDFSGSILAGASNTVGTDSVVLGRLLCTTGMITLLSNTITLPAL